MLSANYRGLYFYHLKKTGGSTFNQWLDTLTEDERIFELSWIEPALFGHWPMDLSDQLPLGDPDVARTAFYCSDVIHSHKPLRRFAPAGTLCFTVLRDPVQRLVSQITDFRRLTGAALNSVTQSSRNLIEDTRRLSLRDHLERYGRSEGRMLLDNHMTRSLAATTLGRSVLFVDDAETLLQVALSGLENDYDLIGLTEHLDVTRNALCATAGWPPAREINRLNRSRPDHDQSPEIAEAGDLLRALTHCDRIVYERACALFEDRHRGDGESDDAERFETRHASRLLAQQRGTYRDGATRYSVRLPMMGSGFHGRDDAGKPTCAVWSGPSTCLTLYMPILAGMQVSLMLWIRGYAAQGQREQIRVRVDGQPAPHRLAPAEGYAEVLIIDACTIRDFVRLEVEIDQTLTSVEAGSEGQDDRKRGIAFDSYGWKLLRVGHPT